MITCFDIGGTFIRHGNPLPNGDVPEAGRVTTPLTDWEAFVAAVKSCLDQQTKDPISISLAGAFDKRTGFAEVANIPCLDGRMVERDLAEALGRQVRITNDANCFTLAEAVDGTGRGKDVVFGIILGSGVGGGLVVRGQVVSGYGGMAGEWGHGPVVDPSAGGTLKDLPHFTCGCGRTGCVDASCSARGMERIHEALSGETLTSKDITAGWHSGETKTSRTVEIYATLLSRALSMIVNTVGPDVVPVSGGLSNDNELLKLVDEKTRALTLAKI